MKRAMCLDLMVYASNNFIYDIYIQIRKHTM